MNKNYIAITLSSLILVSSTALANEKKYKKLDTITIIGQNDSSYINYKKPSITRSQIQAEDMSRSVQVFNNNFINNYQAKEVYELPSLSSNVTFAGHNRSRGLNYNIRGFNNRQMLRDGLAVPEAIPNTEVYNLERIEVLKGPDSIQFGQANPGGLINFVKKKPLKDKHAQIVLDINDNKAISPKVDFGGSINDKLKYRVVASYTKDETFKDFENDFKRVFIAPSLTYDINDNNSVDLVLEVNNEDKPFDFGAISYPNKGKLMHDRKRTISNPCDLSTRKQSSYGFDFNNKFKSIDSTFRYRHINYEFDLPMAFYPRPVDYKNKIVTGNYSKMYWKNKNDILQYTLNHKFENKNFKNNLNIGIDYTKSKKDEFTGHSGYRGSKNNLTQKYDLKNGIYPNHPIVTPTNLRPFGAMPNGEDTKKAQGIFIQNSLNINEKFVINTGLRYDKVKFKSRVGEANSYKKHNITPQVGFVYKINSDISVYTSYSESFFPQDKKNKNGVFLDPEVGKGFELGFRQSLFDGELNITTALFRIQKENVAINKGNWQNPDYIASGKQTSKGLEIDLGGNITDDFAILASYGYVKTKDEDGKKFDNVAQHTANIYGTYKIDNFYFSTGLQYVGSRYASNVKYNSHLISNANISYKKELWTANIGVKNLNDKEYFSSVSTRPGASTIGTPRTIYTNISYSFN